MKKYILMLTILSTISLVGCGHEHTFSDATCTDPRICLECQETEGTALEHQWLEATIENPKKCKLCGLTEGKPLEAPVESEETSSTSVDSAGSDNTVDEGDYTEDTKEFLDIIDKMYEMGGLSDEEYKKERERIIADNGKSDEQIIEEWLSDVPSGGNNVPASDDMQRQFEEALKQFPKSEGTASGRAYGEVDVNAVDASDAAHYRID